MRRGVRNTAVPVAVRDREPVAVGEEGEGGARHRIDRAILIRSCLATGFLIEHVKTVEQNFDF
jgi:hypothetical protein